MLRTRLLTLFAVEGYRLRFAITVFSLMIITTLITSCGYRLSGSDNDTQLFSPLLKNISIEGAPRYDAFRMQLKSDLLGYRMKVVDPQSATTGIIIKNKEIKQHAITLGDDAKVREYLLIAQVDFQVVMNADKPKQKYAMQSIQSEASYAYYSEHISISSNEKKRALTSLNKDLSSKLIARLRVLTKND